MIVFSLTLALVLPAALAIPPEMAKAFAADAELLRCYSHLVNDLHTPEAQAGLAAMYLKSKDPVVFMRNCAAIDSLAKVSAMTQAVKPAFDAADGSREVRIVDGNPLSMGAATNGAGTAYESVFKLTGEAVAGIPMTFVTQVTATNPSPDRRYRFVADPGTMLLVVSDPRRFQYTVVVKGIEFTLAGGESRTDYVWTMCIDHDGAPLPKDLPLYASGLLPAGVRDVMLAYVNDPVLRSESRAVTMKALRDTIASILSE